MRAQLANSSAAVHPAGTVALSRTASVGFSCMLGADMATSQDFATWTCGPRIVPKYLLYALRGNPEQIRLRMMGSTHKTIYMPDIETLATPLPQVTDQRAIVAFLDTEIARIDKLVDHRQKMLELLASRRSLEVLNSATGGRHLDLKPSTLAWADRIPKHWHEVKLSFVARIGSGHTPSRSRPDWWVGCSIPWITTGEVAQMRSDRIEEINETREMISEAGLANSSAMIHPKGTVVLCRTASAGYSAIMGSDMATSQDFATWTCGPLLRPRFLLLCLRAMRPDLLGRLAMGSTHKTIYMPDIESIRIPLPPVDEQDEAVARSSDSLRIMDQSADATHRQIVLLRERRQALITAAVSGELDVPRGIAEEAS